MMATVGLYLWQYRATVWRAYRLMDMSDRTLTMGDPVSDDMPWWWH